MSALDPRVQLAWLAVTVLGALFGGETGLGTAALLAGTAIVSTGAVAAWLRVCAVLLPLALLVALLDALAGNLAGGVQAAVRLGTVASLGLAFARSADGERLIAGLRALRVPYPVVFVLVTGARFVPTTAADLARLRDAARLRGVRLDGPPWVQLRGWRVLLVPLLVGTVRRGLQLGEAMEARAFGVSRRRTVRHRLAWQARDTLALVLAITYLAATIAWDRR